MGGVVPPPGSRPPGLARLLQPLGLHAPRLEGCGGGVYRQGGEQWLRGRPRRHGLGGQQRRAVGSPSSAIGEFLVSGCLPRSEAQGVGGERGARPGAAERDEPRPRPARQVPPEGCRQGEQRQIWLHPRRRSRALLGGAAAPLLPEGPKLLASGKAARAAGAAVEVPYQVPVALQVPLPAWLGVPSAAGRRDRQRRAAAADAIPARLQNRQGTVPPRGPPWLRGARGRLRSVAEGARLSSFAGVSVGGGEEGPGGAALPGR